MGCGIMNIPSIQADIELKTNAILGEGPVWDTDENKLYWVDVVSGRLFKYNPITGINDTYEIGEHIGAAVLREKGGLLLAMKTGFAFFDPDSGKISKIADPESHLPGNRFNDGKCDPAGRFWTGTMSYKLEAGKGSLYCLHPNLTIEQKLTAITISNGLAWNEAENTFYFIDTLTYQIAAFDYEPETGRIQNRKIIKKINKNEGLPDGMTIDEEGCLWVALYKGGRVIRVNPENGETVFQIHLPVPKPTSCTFGGTTLDELFITTAREYMTDEEIAESPQSGSLFKVKLPLKGKPPNRFAG